ncbi:MAG: hypothetical protein HY203_01345 [Nitrospirae bacterium]|nr:hypothetical protein [Nitrospirota bacterium]
MMIGIVLMVWFTGSGRTYAQESGKMLQKNRDLFQLKETEITGKLKDVLGSLKLLETEVVGTVERPRLSYSLPWKDPDPSLLEEGDSRGVFLDEIYTPLDKDTYTQEIRSERARQVP